MYVLICIIHSGSMCLQPTTIIKKKAQIIIPFFPCLLMCVLLFSEMFTFSPNMSLTELCSD